MYIEVHKQSMAADFAAHQPLSATSKKPFSITFVSTIIKDISYIKKNIGKEAMNKTDRNNAPWLDYYGDVPHTLVYPEKTMVQMIEDTVAKYPTYTAYEFMGRTTDYQTFLGRIEKTAKALLTLGIQAGDRVTIAMPNTPQGIDCFYALNRIGAIPNMIHPLSAAEEIVFYLNASHSRAILTLDVFYEKVESIFHKVDHPLTVIVAGIQDELSLVKKTAYLVSSRKKRAKAVAGQHVITWKDFLKQGETADRALPAAPKDHRDTGAILYSGGTTGTTKGILLSDDNINATALQTMAASGIKDLAGLTMLSVMPLFHGFGLGIGIHTALVSGMCCLLIPQFSVKSYAKILKKKKPDLIPGVPTLFEALLRAEKLDHADLSFLQGVFSGGDSLSVELKKKVDAFLKEHNASVQIREGYGTTECVTASCLTPKDYSREGSIGIPFPDTFYCITKVGGVETLPPGEEGEICLRGPSVMIGYMDNEEETENTLRLHGDGNHWLHTGDLGFMDENGFVYFRQRIKRMIITSGYNVYPFQIENILDAHPKVLLSCIVGVKDDYKMQKIKAYIVLRPGYDPSDEITAELTAYCKQRITKYALPYTFEYRSELPKTLVGKVAYRVLEEEANKNLEGTEQTT